MKLQLGTGKNYKEGWVNHDQIADHGADVLFNLETFPWPLEDNQFDYILADAVIEHLLDTVKVMEEIHRISKHGCIVEMKVPHFSSYGALTHLTHKRAFGFGTFHNFEPRAWERYSDVNFETISQELDWLPMRPFWYIKPINKFINWISNKNILFSERFLRGLVGGYDMIYYKLRVIKE